MTDILRDQPEQSEIKQATPIVELKELKQQQEIGKMVTNTFDVMDQLRNRQLAHDTNPFVLGEAKFAAINTVRLGSDEDGYLLHTESARPPDELGSEQSVRTSEAIKQGFVGGRITQGDKVMFRFEAHGPAGEQYFANEPHPGFLGTIIYGPSGEKLAEGDPQLQQFQAIVHQYELLLAPPPPVTRKESETEKKPPSKFRHFVDKIKTKANSGATESALMEAKRSENLARIRAANPPDKKP